MTHLLISIDFAMKRSAITIGDEEGNVMKEIVLNCENELELYGQYHDLISRLSRSEHYFEIMVEAIPPTPSMVYTTTYTPTLQRQGVLNLVHQMLGVKDVTWINANVWQKAHGYKKKKGRTSKGWAKARVEELGHTIRPADGKGTVDLRDSYLLYRHQLCAKQGTKLPGTSIA